MLAEAIREHEALMLSCSVTSSHAGTCARVKLLAGLLDVFRQESVDARVRVSNVQSLADVLLELLQLLLRHCISLHAPHQ